MAEKKKKESFLKWLFSTKTAAEYGQDSEDPMGLGKTGSGSDAEREAARELEAEYRK